MGKRIMWIRTVAGPSIGFGHLRRTLILARMLRPSADSVFLLDADDQWSKEQVRRSRLEYSNFDTRRGSWLVAEPPACLLIDTRKEDGLAELIEEARRRAVPTVSIHDLGLVPLASDAAIDGSVLPFAGSFPRMPACRYGGTAYLVLDPVFASLRRRPKEIRRTIRNVVINLGGGDSSRYVHMVLQGLHSTAHELDVVGVPGFTAWGQEELARRDWRPMRFHWADRDEPVAGLLSGADLAITAGGLAAYEALCLGTPLCAFSYDRFQQMTVEALAKRGACLDLGSGKSLTPSCLSSRFEQLEASVRRRLSLRGRRTVDGRGAQRVARILRSIITMRGGEEAAAGIR